MRGSAAERHSEGMVLNRRPKCHHGQPRNCIKSRLDVLGFTPAFNLQSRGRGSISLFILTPEISEVAAKVCFTKSHRVFVAEFCTRLLGTLQILKHRRRQERGGGSRCVQRPKTGGC